MVGWMGKILAETSNLKSVQVWIPIQFDETENYMMIVKFYVTNTIYYECYVASRIQLHLETY